MLSACVEADAHVQIFEVVAGRSAMIGVAVALVTELITERSVFDCSGQDVGIYGGLVAGSVLSAALLAAAASPPQLGSRFKEAVISSLTAARRSASSVSERQVDLPVDLLFNKVFDTSLVASYLALLEDEFL
jgi:hypothetical protein